MIKRYDLTRVRNFVLCGILFAVGMKFLDFTKFEYSVFSDDFVGFGSYFRLRQKIVFAVVMFVAISTMTVALVSTCIKSRKLKPARDGNLIACGVLAVVLVLLDAFELVYFYDLIATTVSIAMLCAAYAVCLFCPEFQGENDCNCEHGTDCEHGTVVSNNSGAEENYVVCCNCGAKCKCGNKFCTKCGIALSYVFDNVEYETVINANFEYVDPVD